MYQMYYIIKDYEEKYYYYYMNIAGRNSMLSINLIDRQFKNKTV